MALATTVTFFKSPTTVVVNGPAPSDFELLPRTVSEQAANYDFHSYQMTSKKLRRWSLQFTDLTTAQKDSLVDFFTDDVIGPTNTFTYTHTNGTVYTNVRIINDGLQFTRTNPGIFTVSMVLEFDAQSIT